MKDFVPQPPRAAFWGRVSPPMQGAFRPATGRTAPAPEPTAAEERNDDHVCR